MAPTQTFSPLLSGFIARHGWPVVDAETVDGLLREAGDVALFFPGDAERLAESNDVAVVLPELAAACPGLAVVVVDRGSERKLQARYRFTAFPAIVFTRGGGYLGAVSGMRDWPDYLAEIAEIRARAVSDPPPYKLPEGCRPHAAEAAPAVDPWTH